MLLIQKALEELKKNFPKNWTSHYNELIEHKINNESEPNGLTYEAEITSKTTQTAKNFFDLLNQSVIEGEYVLNYIKALEIIQHIENEIQSIGNIKVEIDDENDTIFGNIYEIVNDGFILNIRYSIRRYRHLISLISRRLNRYDDTSTLLDVFREDKYLAIPLNPIITNYKTLFENNIALAKIDYSIKVDKKILQRLLVIKDTLEKQLVLDEIVTFLKQKCDFLIFKIYYRFQQQKEDYLYAIDFIDREIDLEKLQTPYFSDLRKVTESHYSEIPVNNLFTKRRINEFKLKKQDGDEVSFSSYHAITKYYKDEKSNLDRLKILKNDFVVSKNKENKLEQFDKRSYEIALNYITNNIFSLSIDTDYFDFETWENELKEIEKLQEDSSIKNYFPYYKSAVFLERQIENLFSKSELNFALLKKLIDRYSKNLLILNKRIDWCAERCFLPFQLPTEECIFKIEINGKELNYFLASSFVLPINYEKLENEVLVFNSILLKYKTIYEVQLNIKRDKEEIKKLRQNMDNVDKRNVEILSIFSAIVLFVAGDIQLFTKMESTSSAFTFMILFGYILGSFVLLIWFITRGDGLRFRDLSKLHYFIMVLFISGAIFGIALLKGYIPLQNDNNLDKKTIQLNFKIDSLEKELKIKNLQHKLSGDTIKNIPIQKT